MRAARSVRSGIVAGLCLAASVAGLAGTPAIPDTPHAVDGLLYARTFTLQMGIEYPWYRGLPVVTEGMLLVLDVDPALVYPRQIAQPVLYVGNFMAIPVNWGYPAGKVMVIVPGVVDLAKTPIWFGRPELPERVTGEMIARERELAESQDVRPFAPLVIDQALRGR